MMKTVRNSCALFFTLASGIAGAAQAADGKQIVQTANKQWLGFVKN
jgi:hypothetical protein